MTYCIHIQTYPPHFEYANNLINSINSFTNIKELNIPIFIVFDTQKEQEEFNKKYKYDNCKYINIKNIVDTNKINIEKYEKYEDLCNNTINIKEWGSGYGSLSNNHAFHRIYTNVKRVYSILELQRLSYKYIWCIDSESIILKNIDLKNVFDQKINLVIGNNLKSGFKCPQIINDVFKFDYEEESEIFNIDVRINDFWIIDTYYFKEMIEFIIKTHNVPISHIMLGSEMALYEYYLFHLYLKGNEDINITKLDHSLENILNDINKYSTYNQLNDYANQLNKTYFDKFPYYRGDWTKFVRNKNMGEYLLIRLNIQVLVSNAQENR